MISLIELFLVLSSGAFVVAALFAYRYYSHNKDLQDANSALEIETASLRVELQSNQQKNEHEKTLYAQQMELLKGTFKGLANDVLQTQSEQFLTLAQTKQQSFEDTIKPIKEAFVHYQKQIQDLDKGRSVESAQLQSEIKRVLQTGLDLQKQTQALSQALKRPHVRGRWGEMQLKNCIELSGMSEHCDFQMQTGTTTEEGVLIPDLIVRMPGGRQVVVDAKTPLEAFLRYIECATDEERTVELANHGRHLKEHVKKLALKAYNENIKGSADFTVMFLPNESFLYAALETQPDLVEFALHKKILIATPPTFIGLLKVVRFGWNENRMTENAAKISEAGKELYKRVDDFIETFASIGKHIERAKAEYDKGLMRLNSKVIPQARQFENYGVHLKESQGSSAPELPPSN